MMTAAIAGAHTVLSRLPGRVEVRAKLKAKRYAELDAELNAIQVAYEQGQLTESQAGNAWSAFEGYQPDCTSYLQEWVAAFPDSYAANLALGMHLDAKGGQLRTYRLAKDVPQQRWSQIAEAFAASESHLRKSIEATAQPFVAYVRLIAQGMVFGQDTWDVYVEGVRRCPRSVTVRRAQLGRLRIEWGGSREAMHAFLERPEHRFLDDDGRAWLQATVLHQEGHYLEHFEKDEQAARAKYQQAVECRPHIASLSALIRTAADVQEAEDLARRALQLHPENNDVRISLCREYLGRYNKWRPAWDMLHQARFWGEPLAHDMWNSIPIWFRAVFWLQSRLDRSRGLESV